MMEGINDQQKTLLEQYRDKAQIMSLLCNNSYEFFSLLNSLIKIPIIVSSSVMALLNSSIIDPDVMKFANIIINSATALILSLSSNFKIESKMTDFRNIGIKFNKLSHEIDNFLINDISELDGDKIEDIMKNYDALNESLNEPFPRRIKSKIITKYSGKKHLPNCLLVDDKSNISLRNSPNPSISSDIVSQI